IVCYAYPNLGLLCRDLKGKRWVIDLADQSRLPVDPDPVDSATQRKAESVKEVDQTKHPVDPAARSEAESAEDARPIVWSLLDPPGSRRVVKHLLRPFSVHRFASSARTLKKSAIPLRELG